VCVCVCVCVCVWGDNKFCERFLPIKLCNCSHHLYSHGSIIIAGHKKSLTFAYGWPWVVPRSFLNVVCYIASNGEKAVNDEFKKCRRKWPYLILGYCPAICLEKLRNTKKNLYHYRWSLSRFSNPVPPEFKVGVLTTTQRRQFLFMIS